MLKFVFMGLLSLVLSYCSKPSGKKKSPTNTDTNTNTIIGAGAVRGMDPNFETNSNFVKATASPIPTTQHGKGQGRNAEIWYSSNLQSFFGQQQIASVSEGSVAIKRFVTAEGTMITGMVKSAGSWQYYMGSTTQFPTVPLSVAEAQMCVSCHGSQGARTDFLPYISRARAVSVLPGGSALDPNFRTSPNFVKATTTPITPTQHGEGQGRSAEIWYSSNLRSFFGQTSVPAVPDGSVAIKQFINPKNENIVTAMVKAGGFWRYYMGPLNNFPTTPLSSSESQMCVRCHQSSGSQTDMLPYLKQARAF